MRRLKKWQALTALGAVLALSAVTVTTSLVAGASGGGQSLDGSGTADLAPVQFTFNTTTDRGTRIEVTDHGNIVSFRSPSAAGFDYDHFAAGTQSEGYVLCYTPLGGSPTNIYDVGYTESGFGAPTVNVANRTIRRDSLDGRVRFLQTFTFANASKGIRIRNEIINLGGTTLTGTVFRRQADMDVDTGGAQGWAGFTNNWIATDDSVTAWNNPAAAPAGASAHGMELKSLNPNDGIYNHTPQITDNILDTGCTPSPVQPNPTALTDDGASMMYNIGGILGGGSAVVEVLYERL